MNPTIILHYFQCNILKICTIFSAYLPTGDTRHYFFLPQRFCKTTDTIPQTTAIKKAICFNTTEDMHTPTRNTITAMQKMAILTIPNINIIDSF